MAPFCLSVGHIDSAGFKAAELYESPGDLDHNLPITIALEPAATPPTVAAARGGTRVA